MHTAASTVAHERHLAELMRSNRPMTKLDMNDPRLIPVGAMLRSTGLDELPQLFNVLRGEMSLVGPRPCTLREYDAYSLWQRARSGTLPGLTGLWQVSGKNRTTFNEMIELDIRYVNSLCLWLDLSIMLRTPVALFVQVVETIRHRNLGVSSSDDKLLAQVRKPTMH
jgi:lipopolysaccharide/colanic/teichoic acid biosynthesis glycosyltransferase